MGLVDYSDSDVSDTEETQAPVAPSTAKSTFQKVVDRSQPGKIKVSLPQTALRDDARGDEPPTKRVKTGVGALGGFNSFLPAPKRTGQATNATAGVIGGAKKGGLGAGVNLKTGSAPGFARGPLPGEHSQEDIDDTEHGALMEDGASTATVSKDSADEVKLVGKPLMFKPLSVSRKPVKKKKKTTVEPALIASSPSAIPVTPTGPRPPARPKMSLFSTAEVEVASITKPSGEDYTPMMYEPDLEEGLEEGVGQDSSLEEFAPNSSFAQPPPAVPTPPVSQSLADIAGDLRLSAAERRQLFGRQKGNAGIQGATKIINFNTDQEYLHNEELRAAGEQVVHNPVRAIAPGKHSLKQLVNAAQSQKEALEESFAKGRSNRAEASSRYGW